MFARFIANDTWQVPTLVQSRGSRFRTDPALQKDPRLRFVAPDLLKSWASTPDRNWSTERAMHDRSMELVRLMAASGVSLLAGSDTPNSYALPGFGLHDELALLVEAGLTPLQALQTATINPARFFHMEDSVGSVEVRKFADLILLDANPLIDIANAQAIHAVVLNGRLLRRADLDRMLADVAATYKRDDAAQRVPP